MAGIERIWITDDVTGSGEWRFLESRRRIAAGNGIYRQVFSDTLLPGERVIRCTKDEYAAGYDVELGIDVHLNFIGGMTGGVQEKFLFTDYVTVTVEYMQDWRRGLEGDWFKLRAPYYFVGYDREHPHCRPRRATVLGESESGICSVCDSPFTFQDWILLDWPAVQRATLTEKIRWKEQKNKYDGCRSSFRYEWFRSFPFDCVVASSTNQPTVAQMGLW